MKVEISSMLLEQIMDPAAVTQEEICGLLLGEDGRIDAIRPAANVAADRRRHFELDPAILLAAHKEARQGGRRLMGHYHSHPSGIPVPSATDAACATPDGSLWLIVAGTQARLWIATADAAGGVQFVEALLDIR